MEPYVKFTDLAVPFMRDNISTTDLHRADDLPRGVGANLFGYQRYLDKDKRQPNPDFILNQDPWRKATIMVCGRNFGCGSSFEAAPRSVRDYGFKAMIAPSFGGIFANNAYRLGLLPVQLTEAEVREIADKVESTKGDAKITVDLEGQTVSQDGKSYKFKTPPALRDMLLSGLNEIDWALKKGGVEKFIAADQQKRPWVYA
jgi:3-isopropylmalate/(R)-2-methylmalate dehydratase small subunit